MTPAQRKAVDALLHEALQRPRWERADFVREGCRGDEAVGREATDLLEQMDRSENGEFLKHPPQLPETQSLGESSSQGLQETVGIGERPGDRIGPYRLLSRVGEGTFGIVYLAEQTEPMRRRVALKVIKPGMDSRAVIARFEAERQALALMDHPHIAKVFGAGATGHGLPYFVMEYIAGEPITAFCDRQRLTLRQRLSLFRQVCLGIQHAHEKGLIHRDIKPSNILVALKDGGEPLPKVIDFGVAKATTLRLTEKTVFTEQGMMIGTPEYMSPEQAEMGVLDIDTRSDVYSLGALLYELLAGTRPFDLRRKSLGEIQRVIREEEPARPSTKLSTLGEKAAQVAENRRTQASRLAGKLRRELEWIPLKAMRKNRMERYRSAAELADDVGNYLQGRALIAGPESAIYRARKLLRRRKGPIAALAAIMLVLVLGIIATGVQKFRADQEAEAARKAEALAQVSGRFILSEYHYCPVERVER